eukprot:gene9728-10719_t
MTSKKSDAETGPKFFNKLRTLPGISTKLNSWLQVYHNLKHSTPLGKLAFTAFEHLVKAIFNLGLFMVFFTPQSLLASKPVAFVDDFICHQLDFIEKRLAKDPGMTYIVENSFKSKLLQFFILLLRIMLILPRLLFVILAALYDSLRDEVHEDVLLCKQIFLSRRRTVRRSTKRVRPPQRPTSSPSAQRKRKHEDGSDEEVYEYFHVNESYHSENDPDYVIGEATLDDVSSVENGSDEDGHDEEEVSDDELKEEYELMEEDKCTEVRLCDECKCIAEEDEVLTQSGEVAECQDDGDALLSSENGSERGGIKRGEECNRMKEEDEQVEGVEELSKGKEENDQISKDEEDVDVRDEGSSKGKEEDSQRAKEEDEQVVEEDEELSKGKEDDQEESNDVVELDVKEDEGNPAVEDDEKRESTASSSPVADKREERSPNYKQG